MPFYDYLKSFLGIPSYKQFHNNDRNDTQDHFENTNHNDETDRSKNIYSDESQYSGERNFKFDIHTNPFELHRFFEQQMNEIIKSFDGLFDSEARSFGGFFDNDRSFFNFRSNIPELMPPDTGREEEKSRNLRDELLKPGYRDKSERIDTDVDGKISMEDLEELLKGKQHQETDKYDRKSFVPQIRHFGQHIISKTIRGPDGTIETHKTVKDSEGNEETTVTKIVGDKKYVVTTRTDKHGLQNKVEEFVNLDEKDISKLKPAYPNSEFSYLYDRFFKW